MISKLLKPLCFLLAAGCIEVATEPSQKDLFKQDSTPRINAQNKQPFSANSVWQSFCAPEKKYYPHGRWTWIENRVTPRLAAEDIRHWNSVGFGGFELQQLRNYDDRIRSYPHPALRWLSPDWKQCLKSAAETCHELDLTLIVHPTPGWSIGAPFVTKEESGEVLGTSRIQLTNSQHYQFFKKDLIPGPMEICHIQNQKLALDPTIELQGLFLVERSAGWKKAEEITGLYQNECVEFSVPDSGDFFLYSLWLGQGLSINHPPVPGGVGYKPDLFNKEPMEKLLNRIEREFKDSFSSDDLAKYIIGISRDSYESNQNWSPNFDDLFKNEFGYSIRPYLPFIIPAVNPTLDKWDQKELAKIFFDDELERVRYDYNWFINKLVGENHYGFMNSWAKQRGLQFLCQMYGWPYTFDQIENGLKVSAPDGDTWLVGGEWNTDRTRYKTFNKFASSAAHINGINRIDSEVTDWGIYQSTLTPYKQIANLAFLGGATAIRICNLTIDDPSFEWPGNSLFSNFNRHTPWWKHTKLWTENTARISAVLQQSQYAGRLGYFYPQNDMWRTSLSRRLLHEMTYWHEDLWHAAQSAGYGADPVNDLVIQKGIIKNQKLCFGKMEYDALLIAGHESMHSETMAGLIRFAEKGGKVLFLNRFPSRSLHRNDMESGDTIIQKGVARLQALGASLVPVPPQNKTCTISLVSAPWLNPEDAVSWMKQTLTNAGIIPNIHIHTPCESLVQIPYTENGRLLFFFANIDRFDSVFSQVSLPDSGRTPYWWDPDTGTRFQLKKTKIGLVDLSLKPLQSGFLVFEKNRLYDENISQPVSLKKPVGFHDDINHDLHDNGPARTQIMPITASWSLTLRPMLGEETTLNMAKLIDLGTAEDPRLNTFSGEAVYATAFEYDSNKYSEVLLDIGRVYGASEVYLNNKYIGTKWYGFQGREFDLTKAIIHGTNALEVRLFTNNYNLLRSQTDLGRFPQRKGLREPDWTYYPKPEREAALRNKTAPMPCGMLGPVVIKSIQ